ncbi:Carboxypeptidase S1 [Aspergillus sclerotialis]|uniref:Carboxypeptidase n=1 Tax=Aspergillus sclerotialis TaxID=2070753 RepID=A0A3A3AC98_9EURO|nr:Carboxypeptidase S1 [Aspergillus sclerotialis]
MRFLATYSLSLLLACAANAAPASQDRTSVTEKNGIKYNVFQHAATGGKVEFVNNSGICETTPGVNQYSGYFSVGDNMNMWFWFFEARNNPKTAPVAAWFNGGPGCSSMIGLFQENGPCHFVNGESKPSLNKHSWNNDVNMLYVDQPIGVGFSYGNNKVESTETAAPYVWKLLQAFYARFPEYESRDFGLFTESYGGHYGPEFASYIQQKNDAIKSGSVKGENINLEKAYIEYAYNNTYRQLINEDQAVSYMKTYNDDCLPAIQQCQKSGTDSACSNADDICSNGIENRITSDADFDVYDVRQPSNDPYPPSTYTSYLKDPNVRRAIGAQTNYQECSDSVGTPFSRTGDNSRTFLPELSSVVQSGITVLVWAGDADWICNWIGNHEVVDQVKFPGSEDFQGKDLQPYTVNGEKKGTFKTVDNFSFLRVFEAGHEVPYYQPEAALQAFSQTMQKKAISST